MSGINTQFKKGMVPWNKGLKGIHLSPKSEFKKGIIPVNKIGPIEKVCPKCQKTFWVRHSMNRIVHCSQSCAAKMRIGPKHHRWMVDRTQLNMARKQSYDSRYRDWSLSVKNRDGWRCKMANDLCSGRLEAHHILGWSNFPELRYELNNGITLCLAHHPRKRAEEKRLSSYFQSLVSASK